MKIVLKLFITGACSLVLALAGCSSTPSTKSAASIQAYSFNFMRNGAMPSANYSENRQQVHQMIQDAITRNLTQKGLSRSSGAANITVAYLVIIGNNASTAAINDYFGYDRGEVELQDKAQKAYDSSKNPNYFEAGTLVIDIIDSQTNKLLKRSHVTRPVLRNTPEDVRKERIQEAVDTALQDLRIGH